MKCYSIKIALRGVSPMVWRRFRMPGSTSLAQLHHIIQIAYNWDDDHLHQFHIYGKDYGISYLGGVSFADDAHKVRLDDFEFDAGDKFTYVYNFYMNLNVDIRIEGIREASSPSSVYCRKGNAIPGVSKYDEVEPTLKLLKAIVNSDEATTIGDIRALVDELNAVRFNRHYLNKRLQSELVKWS